VLAAGDATCHAVQNRLSFRLFIRTHKALQGTKLKPICCFVCMTWSVTLNEDHAFSTSDNRVTGRIFGLKKEEEREKLKKKRNEGLSNLHST
jgi:hypothetical protein